MAEYLTEKLEEINKECLKTHRRTIQYLGLNKHMDNRDEY